MLGLTVSALISLLVFAVVLWIVFILVKWAVGEFGLPGIITKVAGVVIGLLFLLRLLAVLGIN